MEYTKNVPRISRLNSGGVITNYNCTSKCRHCLYASGPQRDNSYIDRKTLDLVIDALLKGGCGSVHIGGGEPLLKPRELAGTAARLKERGISVEYVETNSSWYVTPEKADAVLEELMAAGVDVLLVSISPFHNEYIPFRKIKGVLEACRRTGMGIFPWVEGFLPDLGAFDPDEPHTLEEYEERFGKGYIENLPGRYWINKRGRALETYKRYMPLIPLDTLLAGSTGGCGELFDTSHFHMDLDGNYLPGLCAGLSIKAGDVGSLLPAGEYPFLTALMTKGIAGLLKTAMEGHGFTPEAVYVSKCHLCQDIRGFLVKKQGAESADLRPAEFYASIELFSSFH